MLSKYVLPGDKIEMQKIRKKNNEGEEVSNRIYFSKVSEILTEDKLEIMMPIEKGKLLLLSLEQEFDVYFHTVGGLYQCFAIVTDRYKTNNVYFLVLELTSNLKKHQRREFYRFGCAMEIETRLLVEEEITASERKQKLVIPDLPFQKSVMADISGGGARFLTRGMYEAGSLVYFKCKLTINNQIRNYVIMGQVLYIQKVENREGVYEHRIQYRNITAGEREEIIRYIFEEERKNRKRENWI